MHGKQVLRETSEVASSRTTITTAPAHASNTRKRGLLQRCLSVLVKRSLGPAFPSAASDSFDMLLSASPVLSNMSSGAAKSLSKTRSLQLATKKTSMAKPWCHDNHPSDLHLWTYCKQLSVATPTTNTRREQCQTSTPQGRSLLMQSKGRAQRATSSPHPSMWLRCTQAWHGQAYHDNACSSDASSQCRRF